MGQPQVHVGQGVARLALYPHVVIMPEGRRSVGAPIDLPLPIWLARYVNGQSMAPTVEITDADLSVPLPYRREGGRVDALGLQGGTYPMENVSVAGSRSDRVADARKKDAKTLVPLSGVGPVQHRDERRRTFTAGGVDHGTAIHPVCAAANAENTRHDREREPSGCHVDMAPSRAIRLPESDLPHRAIVPVPVRSCQPPGGCAVRALTGRSHRGDDCAQPLRMTR
jgi:hypothetical protein